ncbi:phage head spike fiber domain-containing protein [Cohaesibacter celericrescens]|uniref:Uncharacterized protein n=1 Tax=Cohaesibacter celericrescens TaxID=2067669 RepID=A0A2N5XQU5_9HYPH|nr:hypothetical protein [Cohaesibacter celericrescens]PLW76892.1 hypothetical protein C0081_12615 [Cohaesibacter celericrescens]
MLSLGASGPFWLDWQRRATWAGAGSALHCLDGNLSMNGLIVPFSESRVDMVRSSDGWGFDATGLLRQFDPDVVRATDAGLYTEPSSEGLLTNPEDVHFWADDGAASSRTGEDIGYFKIASVSSDGADWHRKRSNVINVLADESYSLSVYFRFGSSNAIQVMARVPDGAGGYAFPAIQAASNEVLTNVTIDGKSSFSNLKLAQIGSLYQLTATLEILHDGEIHIGPGPYSATAGEYVDIAGVQLEAGSVTTSFIVGGGLRSHDTLSFDLSAVDLTGGFYGVWRGAVAGWNNDWDRILEFGSASGHDYVMLRANGSGTQLRLSYYDVSEVEKEPAPVTEAFSWSGPHEIIFGVGPNFTQLIIDGVATSVADLSDYSSVDLTTLFLGASHTGGSRGTLRTDELKLMPGLPTTALLMGEVTAS